MGQRSSLSSPESANPFAIKPMTGARNSTRLNYVPMGLVGRARAAGISNFASQVEPHSDRALLRLSHDRSPLPHFLFALSPAHPLLAPLPAHLSALLPSPRRAFHRVAGARVASFPISSFPSWSEESTIGDRRDRDFVSLASRGRIPDVARPLVTRTLAPREVNMGAVPGDAVVVPVGEHETIRGLVRESGGELRDLDLAAPSRTAVRGGAVPRVVLTGAVVHPRDVDLAGLATLDRREERPCAPNRRVDGHAGGPACAAVRGRSVPDPRWTAVARSRVVQDVHAIRRIDRHDNLRSPEVPAAAGLPLRTGRHAAVGVRRRPGLAAIR